MSGRYRSEGWKYAKISGHENETLVNEKLIQNLDFQKDFLCRFNRVGEYIISSSVGGIHESDVDGINCNKTKSKTDLSILLSNEELINISIKKSTGGQAYLVSGNSFIETFENQFSKDVPNDIKRAINLFWSESPDALEIIEKYGNKMIPNEYEQQIKHKSLNASTLLLYNQELYNGLLSWFEENMYEICKLVFSMGAAKYEDDWAHLLWYINLLGEEPLDSVFVIEDIAHRTLNCSKDCTFYGSKNGGTTIQLPFGFVQWHQHKMQFHHNFTKINDLFR